MSDPNLKRAEYQAHCAMLKARKAAEKARYVAKSVTLENASTTFVAKSDGKGVAFGSNPNPGGFKPKCAAHGTETAWAQRAMQARIDQGAAFTGRANASVETMVEYHFAHGDVWR